jgi:hypothetical protein
MPLIQRKCFLNVKQIGELSMFAYAAFVEACEKLVENTTVRNFWALLHAYKKLLEAGLQAGGSFDKAAQAAYHREGWDSYHTRVMAEEASTWLRINGYN